MAASDYHVAAKLRDAIATAVEHKIREVNPPPRIGRVQRIDRENNICWIIFPGDANPLRVKTTYGNQPQVADYDKTDGSTDGDIVRVQGRTGNYYISEILTSAAYHTEYEQKFVDTDTRLTGVEDAISAGISPSDGIAPTSAPALTVISGIGTMHARWTQITNADPVTYRLHGAKDRNPLNDGSDEITAGVGLTGATVKVVGGVAVVAGGDYRFSVTVEDRDTTGLPTTRPTSPVVSSTPVLVTGPDIATNSVTSDRIVFNTAFGDALNVLGIDASWIHTGTLNADRISVGTQSNSLANSNMEDPLVSSSGTIDTSKFAGWKGSWWEGAAGTISQNNTTPIGGSRSMRVTMAGPADGYRIISKTAIPVVGGQTWSVSMSFRTSRTITTATAGTELINLMFHTSDGTSAPDAIFTTGVTWQVVESTDTVTGGVIGHLSGLCTVPDGHKQMMVSFHAAPANDGSGYYCDFDEVTAELVDTQFQIVDSTGNVVGYISEKGDATFHDGNFTGTLAIDTSTDTFNGNTIDAYMAGYPRGFLSHAQRGLGGTNYATGTNTPLFSQDLYLDSDRALKFIGHMSGNTTVASMRYNIDIRYTYNATAQPSAPTTTSPTIAPGGGLGTFTSSGTATATEAIQPSWSLPNAAAGYYTFTVFLNNTGSGTYNATGQWAFDIFDEGSASAVNSGYWTGQAAGTKSYTDTWYGTYSRWWSSGGTLKGSGDSMEFGNTSATNDGNRRSITWFDYAAIRAKVGTATITKVELYLYIFEGGNNNNVGIGWHTGGPTNTMPTTGYNRQIQLVTNWDQGTGKWVNLTDPSLMAWTSTGTITGYIIGPESSNADSYAAGYRGSYHSLGPKLRITYTK